MELQQPKPGDRGTGVPETVHLSFPEQKKGVGLGNDFADRMPDCRSPFKNETELVMPMSMPIDEFITCHGAAMTSSTLAS